MKIAIPLFFAAAASAATLTAYGFRDVSKAAEIPAAAYDFGAGEQYWGKIDKCGSCATGTAQSPINVIFEKLMIEDDLPVVDSDSWGEEIEVATMISNDGHGIVATADPKVKNGWGAKTTLYETDFPLTEIAFVSHSEHTIDGAYAPLELEFTHRLVTSKATFVAIVSIMVQYGDANEWFDQFLKALPGYSGDVKSCEKLNLAPISEHLTDASFAKYTGSFTYPPCTEGVNWYIAEKPMTASIEQIAKLRAAQDFNARYQKTNAKVEEIYSPK
ncbi:alpha carbonic anhydrase [Chytriomyces cf. hyalinus JEL632]|nr:alpha carbonic anhydrase [Chytriomyces cf. hyalinus JEL632]